VNTAGRTPGFAAIGYGAITEEIVRGLDAGAYAGALLGVLVRPQRLAEAQRKAAGFPVFAEIDALAALSPGFVVECAGHAAVRSAGPAVLRQGIHLMIASVGALADRGVAAECFHAAQDGAQIWIPSGAVAGIDGLLAARTAGLRQVTYTSVKPPSAWRGTPAESRLAGAPDRRMTFFEGTAREAALQYPQNANVGATVAFAGLGLDRTAVKLVSDPGVSGPLGIIEAQGDFGTMRFEILAHASALNPKTSSLTAHSILMALREGLCFSVWPALAEAAV
jgi:aspartate dehydrogenase